MRNAIIPALLLGALVSAPAAAQTTLTPFTGVTFGGETTENRFVYGAVLGFGRAPASTSTSATRRTSSATTTTRSAISTAS